KDAARHRLKQRVVTGALAAMISGHCLVISAQRRDLNDAPDPFLGACEKQSARRLNMYPSERLRARFAQYAGGVYDGIGAVEQRTPVVDTRRAFKVHPDELDLRRRKDLP